MQRQNKQRIFPLLALAIVVLGIVGLAIYVVVANLNAPLQTSAVLHTNTPTIREVRIQVPACLQGPPPSETPEATLARGRYHYFLKVAYTYHCQLPPDNLLFLEKGSFMKEFYSDENPVRIPGGEKLCLPVFWKNGVGESLLHCDVVDVFVVDESPR